MIGNFSHFCSQNAFLSVRLKKFDDEIFCLQLFVAIFLEHVSVQKLKEQTSTVNITYYL